MGFIRGFSTLIVALFGAYGTIIRTGNQNRLKALFTAVNTAFADFVTLPPAVVDDSVDHAVVVLLVHFDGTEGIVLLPHLLGCNRKS